MSMKIYLMFILSWRKQMSRKRVYFTEDQFQAIYELVSERVDYLVERSIDLQDSEILDDHEDLLDAHTVLEEADKWVLCNEED